ncbi:hypothetical protein C5E51_16765 [Nocardia nova]|uniref:hypothetical protein n=1 Tax=Nocardia nova TaxID=37330 RepID=UPI000CE9F49E|nr:hypothetical protein [Nocardia nova]PPJ07826.1 hypothetical protein C5E51_16765 [Nocardia nova]
MSTNTNDLDDPYINRYAGRIENPEEVLMRADFDRAKDLHAQAWNAPDDDEYTRLTAEADRIRHRWAERDDDLGEAWQYLDHAYDDWNSAPETMTRFHARVAVDEAEGFQIMTDMQRRSQQHARELTGHGEWMQTSETEQAAAGREPIPGHAFAGLVNGHDREGMER